MKKTPVKLTSYAQDFTKLLDTIKPSKNRYEIFSDWLIVASAALYSWKRDKSVEEEYLQVVKQYKAPELEKLCQLLAITVEALEEKTHDFLGEVFTEGNLSNEKKGQFFTPFHVSQLMAKLTIGERDIKNYRVIRVIDPCCGSGGLLIAGILEMEEHGINYQKDVLFNATDIDHRCARMCFIQLSLLAAPAVITCGNSLTMETFWQRETIGYHLSDMDKRINMENIIDFVTKPEFLKDTVHEKAG